jgi:hypothetical protein
MFESGTDKEYMESEIIDMYDITVPLPKYDTGLLVRKQVDYYNNNNNTDDSIFYGIIMSINMESVLYTVQYHDDEIEICNEQEIEELIITKTDTITLPPELSSFIVAAPTGTKNVLQQQAVVESQLVQNDIEQATTTATTEQPEPSDSTDTPKEDATTTIPTESNESTTAPTSTDVDVVMDEDNGGEVEEGTTILDTIDPKTKLEQLKKILETLAVTNKSTKKSTTATSKNDSNQPKRKYKKREYKQKYKNGTNVRKVCFFSFFLILFYFQFEINITTKRDTNFFYLKIFCSVL